MTQLNCSYCQTTFERSAGEHAKALRKGRTQHYCSRQCADRSRATGDTTISLTCDACGSAFSRVLAEHNRAMAKGLKSSFCSPECSAIGRRIEPRDLTVEELTRERRDWDSGKTIAERIAYYSVPMPNGCIEWNGPTNGGRPALIVGGKQILVSRLVWLQHKGTLPNDLVVRHVVCRNSKCINIDHLDIGTHKENAADRDKDGMTVRGEHHHRACLTEDQVREIRSSNTSLGALAKQYGVGKSTIKHIKDRTSWKHVP